MTLNGSSDDANDITWGAFPQFVWPSVGDRVWVAGNWVFDCGHPGPKNPALVQFESEIHAPQAFVTFRLNHPAGNIPFVNQPFPFGVPQMPVTGLTGIPVVEADMFVSGNGGGSNDICSQLFRNINIGLGLSSNPCLHSGPITGVNTMNYVFDIYPPGTDYTQYEPNGTRHIAVPTRNGSGTDVALQYAVIDRTAEIPAHAGRFLGSQGWTSSTLDGLICLLDSSTPPPTQNETTCPLAPPNPSRLRVILPFAQSKANVFAKTIILGWDDVPDNTCPTNNIISPATMSDVNRTLCARIRDFEIDLHEFRINDNAEGSFSDGDWRVFVDVGGQWRYVSGLPFEHDDGCSDGDSLAQDNGKASIVGSADGNGSGDCFRFDRHPWKVRIQDGVPIHIAVGGFESDNEDAVYCRDAEFGCDPSVPADGCLPWQLLPIGGCRDDRIGTYEFDLVPPSYALSPRAHIYLPTTNDTGDISAYEALFQVTEQARQSRIASVLRVGAPSAPDTRGGWYISPNTPLALVPTGAVGSQDSLGVQYRLRKEASPPPTFSSGFPFPMHWTHTGFSQSGLSSPVSPPSEDGQYYLDFSAQLATGTPSGLVVTDTQIRNTIKLTVDTTPPVVTPPANIVIPATEPSGTRASESRLLKSFLDGAVARDVLDPAPTLGIPQINGVNVNPNGTVFPIGTTTVTFRATDAIGNVGTTTANVTVIRGRPELKLNSIGFGVDPEGRQFEDVQLTNVGSGNAKNISLTNVEANSSDAKGMIRVLGFSYVGKVAVLPFSVGNADSTAFTHRIRIYYSGPSNQGGTSVVVSGTMQDVTGAAFKFKATVHP
jgi:hypothetical protein